MSVRGNSQQGVTQVEVKEYTYTWTIKNFKFLHRKVGQRIESPPFTNGENDQYIWRLWMYPYGHDSASKDYLSLQMRIYSKRPERQGYLIVSLVDRTGKDNVYAESHFSVTYMDLQNRKFDKLVRRDDLFNEEKGLLVDGDLTIRCKVYFEDHIVNCDGLVGNIHTIKKERSNDLKVMQEVLRYISSGIVENIEVVGRDLLAAANKYELDGLKALCEDALIKGLNVGNVGEMLILADRHQADALKAGAMKFLSNMKVTIIEG